MHSKEFSCGIGGHTLTAEFSDLAEQAHGSAIVRYRETAILATAVMSKESKDVDYLPLIVDFEDRFYARGKIPGGKFVRREGKPSDEAILSGRIVDRAIRPLFDQGIRNEIQIILTVIASGEGDRDAISVIAASLAIGTSNIPWKGPVSSIKIGKRVGLEIFDINPQYSITDGDGAELELLACGSGGLINMIETGSREIGETALAEILKKASAELEPIQNFQKKIIKAIGRKKNTNCVTGKHKKFFSFFKKENESDFIHREALAGRRADGRSEDEIRPIFAKAGGVSKMLHGSGTFYRGGTHILSVLTLGGPKDSLIIDGASGEEHKRFIHHYNFPPFSTGETGRVGNVNRRMIGHGALAEKALLPVIPSKENFPYTIRIVSEALASNGSTSMGSVCASTLALLDAGVPIKSPVAGIASGLMMKNAKEYKILTDIQGPEDEYGDMDFKVAGTRCGITALQMDVKVDGIPIHILIEALEKSKTARLKILDIIEKEIGKPRENLSSLAPRILIMKIKPSQIGLVIGSGGKTINEIKDITGAEIDIENDGSVYITGKNGSSDEAEALIRKILR